MGDGGQGKDKINMKIRWATKDTKKNQNKKERRGAGREEEAVEGVEGIGADDACSPARPTRARIRDAVHRDSASRAYSVEIHGDMLRGRR